MAPTVLDLLFQAHQKQKEAQKSHKRLKITPKNTPSSSQKDFQSSTNPSSQTGTCYERPKRRAICLKRSSKLHMLPSLPLDILFEIFGHLSPSDLLQLTRTSKNLRELLLEKSATTIWKSSFRRVVDIPCPTDVSYPAWASLMYDKECHICSAPNIRTYSYHLRIRLCGKCVKKHLTEEYDWPQDKEIRKLIEECIPCATWGRTDRNVCLAKTIMSFLEDLRKHARQGQKATFVEGMKEQLKPRVENAELWHKWSEGLFDERQKELDNTRSKRGEVLKNKLRAEGYEAELLRLEQAAPVPYLTEPFSGWEYHPLVKQPKPLTDRNWDQIKDGMIRYMEQVKTIRLREERRALIWQRREIAATEWQAFRGENKLASEFLPNQIDVWLWEPIKSIIEKPSDALVNASSFNKLFAPVLLGSFVAKWQEDKHCQLRRLYPFDIWHPRQPELKQATCVFSCTRSSFHSTSSFGDWFDGQHPCMWYPEFLHHPCNTLDTRGYWLDEDDDDDDDEDNHEQDPVEKELRIMPSLRTDVEFKGFRRRRWSTRWLMFDQKASRTVENILEACELSPYTLTEALDAADPRLVCLKCSFGAKCDGERRYPILTWRGAVQHSFKKHWGDAGVAWQKISDEDAAAARAAEANEPARRNIQIPPEKSWRCGHCKDTSQDQGRMTFSALESHFDTSHGGKTGIEEGLHYYKSLDRPPREPLITQMIPKGPCV
ncbi:hypothetical protein AAF712_003431 [Marasmius tenuissimus]|uniref:F-box domain-containing protein n=1 Tax=Marasmius tenuissimus TaxID=585030 RepID=A0ABR3A7W0_9AGAR